MYKYMMTTIFLYRFNIAIQRLTDEDIRNIGIDKLLFIFCCFDNDYTQLNKPMPMLEGMFGWWLKKYTAWTREASQTSDFRPLEPGSIAWEAFAC